MTSHKTLFETPQKNAEGKPFITVKDNDGYTYAERLGVDSVAFVLYNRHRGSLGQFGLIYEYKPPIDMSLITAFGGSLDKEQNCIKTIADEVAEEAGYTLNLASCDYLRIKKVGTMFVSTQMNQMCTLYLVDVAYLDLGKRNPQSKHEETAEVVWLTEEQVYTTNCWKAITTLTLAKQGKLI